MNSEEAIRKLRYFGQAYHSYFGFDANAAKEQYVPIDRVDEIEFWEDYANDRVKDESEIYFNLCPEAIKEDAEAYIPYDEVLLTLPDDYWTSSEKTSEKEWYNEPSTWWTWTQKGKDTKHLSYLKSRSYITVEVPYKRIKLSAMEKGNPLTIEDVLFASRGLCRDDTRTIDDFIVLENESRFIHIQPDIDNWSI